VPALLIPQDRKPHIGSVDVDLALNHRTLTGPGYKTICRLLEGRGYAQDKKQPFIFWRTVKVVDKEIVVEVDLLAGEYEERQNPPNPDRARCSGTQSPWLRPGLPAPGDDCHRRPAAGGAKDSTTVRIASIVPFLAMKGMALAPV